MSPLAPRDTRCRLGRATAEDPKAASGPGTLNRRFRVSLLLFACLLTGCEVPLVAGLQEASASEVLVALGERDIAASKEADPEREGMYLVTVSPRDVAVALTTLQNSGLPAATAPGVLEALGDSSLIPTRNAEHARLLVGTAGELERSLTNIRGVLSARVHLAAAEPSAIRAMSATTPASASVLIRHRGTTPPLSPSDVQRLVSGAVASLTPEAVAVVMHPVADTELDPAGSVTRVGPLAVARSSVLPLKLLLCLIAVLNLAMVGALLFLWTRLRRAQHSASGPDGEGTP